MWLAALLSGRQIGIRNAGVKITVSKHLPIRSWIRRFEQFNDIIRCAMFQRVAQWELSPRLLLGSLWGRVEDRPNQRGSLRHHNAHESEGIARRCDIGGSLWSERSEVSVQRRVRAANGDRGDLTSSTSRTRSSVASQRRMALSSGV